MKHLVTRNYLFNSSSLTIFLHSFLESKILKTVMVAKIIIKHIKNILLYIESLSININSTKNKNHKNRNIFVNIKFIILI